MFPLSSNKMDNNSPQYGKVHNPVHSGSSSSRTSMFTDRLNDIRAGPWCNRPTAATFHDRQQQQVIITGKTTLDIPITEDQHFNDILNRALSPRRKRVIRRWRGGRFRFDVRFQWTYIKQTEPTIWALFCGWMQKSVSNEHTSEVETRELVCE